MSVLFVIYGVAGGLTAAIVTDFVQGILTLVFSFMLLPIVLNAVGGMAGLHEALSPDKFALVAPKEIGLFYVVMIVQEILQFPDNLINGMIPDIVQLTLSSL